MSLSNSKEDYKRMARSSNVHNQRVGLRQLEAWGITQRIDGTFSDESPIKTQSKKRSILSRSKEETSPLPDTDEGGGESQ